MLIRCCVVVAAGLVVAGLSSCGSTGLEDLESVAIEVAPFPEEAGGFARTGWRFDDSTIEATYETQGAIARGAIAKVSVTFGADAPLQQLLPGHLEQYLGTRTATQRGALSIGDRRFIFVNFEEERASGRTEVGCLAGRVVGRDDRTVEILLVSAWSDRFDDGDPTTLVRPLLERAAAISQIPR